jgi:hypothetical protein
LHLSAIVKALCECPSPCHVLRSFSSSNGRKVIADIVSEDGFKWTKVIARSPTALERLSTGDQAYGQRSLMDQGRDYVNASELNLHHFKPPTLVFVFHAGVPELAASKLTSLGIQVEFFFENSTFSQPCKYQNKVFLHQSKQQLNKID